MKDYFLSVDVFLSNWNIFSFNFQDDSREIYFPKPSILTFSNKFNPFFGLEKPLFFATFEKYIQKNVKFGNFFVDKHILFCLVFSISIKLRLFVTGSYIGNNV